MNTIRNMATALSLAVAGTAFNAPLNAQISEVSRTPIADAAQITFGYLCDDRFVIRNDGTKSVDLEYGIDKGNEHTKLTLNSRESVELASKSKKALELWMDGKLVARADKGKRSCKDVQGNSQVTVTPLEVAEKETSRPYYNYGAPFGMYDPWGFGMYYGYGFGYRPYAPLIISRPVIVGGRGGGGRRGR